MVVVVTAHAPPASGIFSAITSDAWMALLVCLLVVILCLP